MPKVQLIPLLPKAAGILKDGSGYQGDFCTDGQWVRFYQGKPKKMGGQLAVKRYDDSDDSKIPQGATHITSVWLGDNIIYLAITPTGIFSNIAKVNNPSDFSEKWIKQVQFDEFDEERSADMLWQSQIVVGIDNDQSSAQTYVVLFGCNNLKNINSITPAKLYKVSFKDQRISTVTLLIPGLLKLEPLMLEALQNLNGGIVFVDNFLFGYGTRGTVLWSNQNNPFSYIKGTSGSINISNDKVIYGAGVRGGNNPPTVLFWTMNSVVRVSNQTNASSEEGAPEFQVDIITKECSILSSRSVVEYDGIFFWLGIDRIFLYNGLVREVVNNVNFDWFFTNLDVSRRQLVFGIKNSEKGEIWWYFPVKFPEGKNAIDYPKGCSAALIYNIRENTWYNTDILRDCGFFDGSSGKMITYGQSLTVIGNDKSSYIWIHEEGYQQMSDQEVSVGITSHYTTPAMSLTAFSPFGEGAGLNNEIWVDRIEPDFNLKNGATMDITVNSRDYGCQKPRVIFTGTIKADDGKVDILCQGRNISFTFKSESDFQHGFPLIGIKQGNGWG